MPEKTARTVPEKPLSVSSAWACAPTRWVRRTSNRAHPSGSWLSAPAPT
ncbi:MAG: hypothetical protein MUP03_01550 [Anaerolineales bacterium]|nr:hypothetical protein [Anaerolineales bacterium]